MMRRLMRPIVSGTDSPGYPGLRAVKRLFLLLIDDEVNMLACYVDIMEPNQVETLVE